MVSTTEWDLQGLQRSAEDRDGWSIICPSTGRQHWTMMTSYLHSIRLCHSCFVDCGITTFSSSYGQHWAGLPLTLNKLPCKCQGGLIFGIWNARGFNFWRTNCQKNLHSTIGEDRLYLWGKWQKDKTPGIGNNTVQLSVEAKLGGLKMQDWKMQDWKTRDQISRGGKGGTGKRGNIMCMGSEM